MNKVYPHAEAVLAGLLSEGMARTSKHGEPKGLKRCSLPLTGQGVVNRIITNLGVLDVVPGGPKIVDCAEGLTEADLRAATRATIFG